MTVHIDKARRNRPACGVDYYRPGGLYLRQDGFYKPAFD
jgi:hypothetical protein